MDEMIKQVSLLADIIKEIQEDIARSKGNERMEDEEGVLKSEDKGLTNTEQESRGPLEKQEEVRTVKAEPTEEESQAKEEPIVAPLMDDMTCEIPEGVKDEPQGKKEEDIKRCKGLGASLVYLQKKTEHIFEEETEKFVPGVERENAQAERPRYLH